MGVRKQWRHRLYLYFFRGGVIHPAYCLHQLHELVHGTGVKSSQRGWCEKGGGRDSDIFDQTVPGRIDAIGRTRGYARASTRTIFAGNRRIGMSRLLSFAWTTIFSKRWELRSNNLEKLSESIHMMPLEQCGNIFLWEVCRNVCCDIRSPVESVAHGRCSQ